MTFARKRLLLGSAATLACGLCAAGAEAQTFPVGGGSSLASPTYTALFRIYQPSNPTVDFSDVYTTSGSGAAQTAVITNTGNTPNTPGPFDFAASDATISDAQIVQWNGGGTNPFGVKYGRALEGALVELPTIGTPITVPVNLVGVGANGAANLADADLCGIFAGRITQWSQVSAASSIPPGNGAITVVYRGDSSGTSFLFTQHLKAVCGSTTNTVGNPYAATTSFSSLFIRAGSSTPTLPSNFVPGTQSPGVQTAVDAAKGTIGYLSPDYTMEVAKPTTASASTPAPFVAFVNGQNPTPANTQTALATGTPVPDLTIDPSGKLYNPADPNSFIPVAAKPSAGYPIVGYTTFLLPQCYADPNIASAIKSYLTNVYRSPSYTNSERANGFTALPTALINRINGTYLVGAAASLISSVGATGCTTAGLVGR